MANCVPIVVRHMLRQSVDGLLRRIACYHGTLLFQIFRQKLDFLIRYLQKPMLSDRWPAGKVANAGTDCIPIRGTLDEHYVAVLRLARWVYNSCRV